MVNTKERGNSSRKQNARKQSNDTSSAPRIEEVEAQRLRTTAPWPRPDNTPIESFRSLIVPHITAVQMQRQTDYASRKHGDPWGHYTSTFYNGLLRVEMLPTKFVCMRTLRKMGIAEDVKEMLTRMGFGTFAYQSYPLYPELVRQFLASAELIYEDAAFPLASEGTLTFFSSGILYEISIRELCDLYGFDRNKESCRFPADFPQAIELWHFIGSGPCISRENKLSLLRNPVVRIVAKILGHTLFAKEETGSLREDELTLIHFGLPSFVRDIYSETPPPELNTNLGAIFAEVLVQKKFRGLNTARPKMEAVGSLLTPIFQFHQIDLSKTKCEDKLDLFDEKYLKHSFILKPGNKYQFHDRSGTTRRCQLPLQALTALTSLENLEFLPGPEYLCHIPSAAAPRHRGSSSRSGIVQSHLEDARVPARESMEHLLPAYTGEFDLPPLPADASDGDRWAWMVESQRKNNSMMQKIWGALAKLTCPRPPSCFRASETTETDAVMTNAAGDFPDVAERGTTEEDDTGDASDPKAFLSRRRRAPGQSQSATSDSDH